MKQERSKRLIAILLLIIGLFFSKNVQAQEEIVNTGPSQNFVYINKQLGIRVDGPKGWYGIMQVYDSNGNPLINFMPRNAKALYGKYYGPEEKLHPFNPTLEIIIVSKDYSSPDSALKAYVAKIPGDDFLIKPVIMMINDKEYAVCSYKVETMIKGSVFTLIRKLYLLFYKDAVVLIQTTDTQEEFVSDEKIFDEAIANMQFSDNYLDLIRK